jgi:L,D-transpeptidase catalytic domain
VRATRAFVLLSVCTLACERQEQTAPNSPAAPRYYIVGKNGAQTHDAHKLLPGFGVVIQEQFKSGHELFGRSSLGREIAMKDLRPARPSRFAGVHVDDGNLDFGWVIKDGAAVYPQADVDSKPVARRAHYARLGLLSRDGPQGFYRVADGWMSEADLRVPHRVQRPASVGDGEPWIDVELATQTLVAYLGDRPVFATLVATGVGAEGTPFATPKGLHRVRAKLLAATMDNLNHTGVVPYSYEEVPFTQYIGRVALHGAFWHDQFGVPRSHGCINLSLADAEWLFGFTRPVLPEGENEIATKAGTVVQVR